MWDRPDPLRPWDYAMILFGAWLCYVAATAVWIEPTVRSGIGLQNGVLQVMGK